MENFIASKRKPIARRSICIQSNTGGLKPRWIRRHNEGKYKPRGGTKHQGGITIINSYAPNIDILNFIIEHY
jgi:hypothetical protein